MSTAAGGWIEVAAAVLEQPDGRFLLASRPAGKVYAGWWEFPGGKCEAGEPPAAALARELHEELGIRVTCAVPWIVRTHDYAHGRVRLHFFRVTGWEGEPRPREGQSLAWQRLGALDVAPILPANGPILSALSLPLCMGVSQAATLGSQVFLQRLEAALAAGLRLVQVREPGLPEDDLHDLTRAVVSLAHRAGAEVVLNGPEAVARRSEADGLHLSARALAACAARPDFRRVGASCHDRAELERAARLGLDYALLGPVLPTASHPGAAGLGWEEFARLVRHLPLPVYAIGGMELHHVEQAREAGAHGVAAIRSAWRESRARAQ